MRLLHATPLLAYLPLASCADQKLSDDRAIGSISGSLGIAASKVLTNNNFTFEAARNRRFVCTINGGHVITVGMTNGAACRRLGTA